MVLCKSRHDSDVTGGVRIADYFVSGELPNQLTNSLFALFLELSWVELSDGGSISSLRRANGPVALRVVTFQ